MSKNLLACRLGSYKQFVQTAWTHLPTIGVGHIETTVPTADEAADLRARLEASGLKVSSFQVRLDLNHERVIETAGEAFAVCEQFGVDRVFTSVKTGDGSREHAYARLQAIGDAAREHGVIVVIETHPDLATNGDVAAETMRAVEHPNVRVNFDTANIYFYNEGADAVSELGRVLPYVEAVHLKDTRGGVGQFDFPTLGEGVVDFPTVFRLLDERGFAGPFTMELEGSKGVERDEEQIKQHVADSVAHLRRSGCIE